MSGSQSERVPRWTGDTPPPGVVADDAVASPPSDKERAHRIRTMLCELNKEINEAKTAGLKVEFTSLHFIGTASWLGFHGSVKIIREL